jgi:hypothetical protein
VLRELNKIGIDVTGNGSLPSESPACKSIAFDPIPGWGVRVSRQLSPSLTPGGGGTETSLYAVHSRHVVSFVGLTAVEARVEEHRDHK